MGQENKHINSILKLGDHYKKNKDYENMEKYYKTAMELNSITALNNLASYYCDIKDYSNMKKCYTVASDINNIEATKKLVFYYRDIENNYDNMKFYLLRLFKLYEQNITKKLELEYKDFEIKLNNISKNRYLDGFYMNNVEDRLNKYISNIDTFIYN